MKNLSWKKIAVGGVAIAVFVAGFFYFQSSSGNRTAVQAINPAFGEYITSYTAGVLSSGSTVRIILANDVVDSSMVGTSPSAKLFDFSPALKGSTTWVDARTVEFKPEGRMASGQVYEVSFQLGRLMEVSQELSTFTYSFQVVAQNYDLQVDNVKPYVKTDLKRQKIEGSLFTADFAEEVEVEKILLANQDGNNLKISWTHTPDGKQHVFVVEDVARKETASKVELSADGKPLGVAHEEKQEVEIPSLSDFKVMQVKVEQSANQHLVIQFSDPLSEKQNLEGLVRIQGLQSLDFEIRDNEILVYPPVRQTGSKTVYVEAGVRNILDYKMKAGGTFDVMFEQVKPAVRFTGKGNILPSSDGLIMPFEAVNLKSVDVQIIKIFENNVIQFLQVSQLDGNSELRRVGKPILNKRISLENMGVTDLGKWNRFTLELSKLINTEPGAIYQVRIGFKQSYLAYFCDGAETESANLQDLTEDENWDDPENENSSWDSYEEYYYDEDYDWQERENPCHSSYYTGQRTIKRNVLASDLGLLAKRGGDESTLVFVNDLRTTQPVSGVEVELFNFQQQSIGNGITGPDGSVSIASKESPFVLVARNQSQRGYLRMPNGESLSLSSFDVRGEVVQKGLKGFLYGERGVWRPGDSLHLSFILEDKLKKLPATHPVIFELQNPQGQVTSRLVRSSSENGFYRFSTATDSEAPTGNWTARVKVGGTQFTKPIKIETIKPNRLKINLDFGVDKITHGNANVSGDLKVNWLHGAPGKNLKAQFEVVLSKATTKFEKYPDYVFEDISRDFYSESKTIYEGYTDAEGNARVSTTLDVSDDAPGMLTAVFRGKVFEESGNFSIDKFDLPYYPFPSFTGIRLPPGDKARGMLLTDTTHRVDVVVVNADGKPMDRSTIEMSIHKLNWRWWWDDAGSEVNFMSGRYAEPISKSNISVTNGKGQWTFKIKYPEWGRYYVKACDPVSGHCTGKVVYIDWPGWAGRAREGADGATMLTFSSDKTTYNIGEKANIVIPGSGQGRALVSIENGSKVIQTYWVETQKGDNPFSFDITKEMTPNVFVNVTMIQPHAQTVNDLPIRLYGVIPLKVEDPQTHLSPVIVMPDVLEPGQEVIIKVSEKDKRKMTYTVAMVDEGLLDITRYKTPDPWNRFYAREALGVKTWDIYDQVMGAFGARIERLLAVGGDEELKSKEDDTKANRFKPVVKYFGPFTLDGSTNEHRFIMPQYIGSVKTMVVAGYDGAYGNAEKATPVRKPLMVLATLPRVLGPDEKVKLPVTLFSMDKSIRNVKVEIKTGGLLKLAESTKSVAMNDTDMTVDFDLSVASLIGVGKVEVIATSGNFKATDVIEINVRNPNPPATQVQEFLLESGKAWNINVDPIGMVGTNSAILEISSLPPVNLGQRLKYLMQYPYGCIEQTTSAVFPQLYLDQVKVLTDGESERIQTNIKAGIERLKTFVHRDGGFAYWPGADDSDSWGSTYAGHFLVEAEAKGYYVPNDMIRRWKKYQKSQAQNWRKNAAYGSSELMQAYRLYTLALAGDADLASMNRLREQTAVPPVAMWMLAAAYAKAGQPEAAKKLIANLTIVVKPYQELAYSYGSDVRDKAIMLETLVMLDERTKAFELLKEISKALSNSNSWMSTQSVAWSLKAVGAFAGNEKRGEIKFNYSYNGKDVNANTQLPISQVALDVDGVKTRGLKVTSQSSGTMFARLIIEGTPTRGEEKEGEANLLMNVSYTDTDGNKIDPSRLEQGKEFMAVVSITNPGVRGNIKNMALKQIFPSGWEINNLRFEEVENRVNSDKPTYQDIKDDRVYTYFDLRPNERKTFRVLLTASYAGEYYLPGVSCEAMYDNGIYSMKKGFDVAVVKPVVQ